MENNHNLDEVWKLLAKKAKEAQVRGRLQKVESFEMCVKKLLDGFIEDDEENSGLAIILISDAMQAFDDSEEFDEQVVDCDSLEELAQLIIERYKRRVTGQDLFE